MSKLVKNTVSKSLHKDLEKLLNMTTNYKNEIKYDQHKLAELITSLRSQTSVYYENSQFNWSKMWNEFIVKILNDMILSSPDDIKFGQTPGFKNKPCTTTAWGGVNICLAEILNTHSLQFGDNAVIDFKYIPENNTAVLDIEKVIINCNKLRATGEVGDSISNCHTTVHMDLAVHFELNMQINLSCNCISPDSQKGENLQGWRMENITIHIPKNMRINPEIKLGKCNAKWYEVPCLAECLVFDGYIGLKAQFASSVINSIKNFLIEYFHETLNNKINEALKSFKIILPVQCNITDYCSPPSDATSCNESIGNSQRNKPTISSIMGVRKMRGVSGMLGGSAKGALRERFTDSACQCGPAQNYLWTPKDGDDGKDGLIWNVKPIGLNSQTQVCQTDNSLDSGCMCSGGITSDCCKWPPNYYQQTTNNICNINKVSDACLKNSNGWQCKFQNQVPDLLINTFNWAWPTISKKIIIGDDIRGTTLAPNASIADLIFENEKILLNVPVPYTNTIAALSVSVLQVSGLDGIRISKGDTGTLAKFASDCQIGSDINDSGVIRAAFREVSLEYSPEHELTIRIGIGLNLNPLNHKAVHTNYMCPPGRIYPYDNGNKCCSKPVSTSSTDCPGDTTTCLAREQCVNPNDTMNICWYDYCKDRDKSCRGHGVPDECSDNGLDCLSNYTCTYDSTENCSTTPPNKHNTPCEQDSTIFNLTIKVNPELLAIKADLEAEFQCCPKNGIWGANKPMGIRKLKVCNAIAEQIEILDIECDTSASESEKAICAFLSDKNVKYFMNASLAKTWNNFIWPMLGDVINDSIAGIMPNEVQGDNGSFPCPAKLIDWAFDPIPNSSCPPEGEKGHEICKNKLWCTKADELCFE